MKIELTWEQRQTIVMALEELRHPVKRNTISGGFPWETREEGLALIDGLLNEVAGW